MMKEEEGLVSVIVGIDGYKDIRPLHCAVNDAVYLMEALQKVWKNRKVNIKTLIWPSLNEEQAKSQGEAWGLKFPKNAVSVTRESILSEVRECARQARQSDTFVFYFSGHGVLADEEPSIITVSDGKTAKGIVKIKIKEIQQAAASCASQKKVMILDCCQSLSGRNKNKTVEWYNNLKDLTQGWSIFLSSSPGEASLEDQYFGDSRDDYLQQGIFTASLVEGLRGEATGTSGSVSLADLAYYVSKRVPIEYHERISTLMTIKGARSQVDTRGRGTDLFSQNPVLLSDILATGGPYMITMAPEYVPTSQMARRIIPSKNFIKCLFKFLLGQWPLVFPHRLIFREGGASLYALTIVLTVLLRCPKVIDNMLLLFLGGIGLGSAFLWWVTLSFAVAANEDRWYPGSQVTPIFYLLWHCVITVGFAWQYGVDQSIGLVADKIFYLALDLFFIFVVVVIYGCNSSQTIIALAETVRPDERREIRQAIRAFQQFKYKILGVDLYNYVAMVAARPSFYYFLLVISILIVGLNTYIVIVAGNKPMEILRVFLIRNIIALIFVTWLVFWYQAAFQFIQREVYKR